MSRRLRLKHSLLVRWLHWLHLPVLLVMIWSGLLIYGANRVYRIGFGDWTLFAFDTAFAERLGLRYRLAEGMAWHFAFAWPFAIVGTLYLLHLAFGGGWRRLFPRRGDLRGAWSVFVGDLRRWRSPPEHETDYNAAQRLAYTGVLFLGIGALLSGLAICKPIQLGALTALFGGYQSARWIHFWITWAFVAFVAVHVLQVIRAGWNTFRAMITGRLVVSKEEEQEP